MKQAKEHSIIDAHPQMLYGIGASPGIVIGRALQIDRRIEKSKHIYIGEDRVAPESRRFKYAVKLVEEQLDNARKQFAEHLHAHAPIIDTHKLMLRDQMLFDQTLERIESEAINAEWALEKSLAEIKETFEAIEDEYIRERFRDIEQVAHRLFMALGGNNTEVFTDTGEKVIIVARDFSPEDTLRMKSDRVLGFVAEMGGATSHTAIVTRTLGIPSVVGVENITDKITSGDILIVDGGTGRVLLHPATEQLQQYKEFRRQQKRYSKEVFAYAHLKPETLDGLSVDILANIEMPEEAQSALKYGATGIGLFRSEYYYICKKKLPDEEALFSFYKGILCELNPYPVTIRTLDIGGDKLSSSVSLPAEMNPAMGLRAIRFCLREPQIFNTQLRALLRASVYGNLRIIFPMIASLCEIQRVKETVHTAMEQLRKEGLPYNDATQFGIMIEVPSAVSIADVLAREVDFFSIGTNDLIQYALAIDRVNEYVAHMYEPLSPAVLRMVKQVVDAGHEAGIEVGMCGEMAGDSIYLPLLLGFGLDALSMHPFAIPYIKRMIRNSTMDMVEQLSQEVMRCSSTKEVRELLADYLPRTYPDAIDAGKLHWRNRPC